MHHHLKAAGMLVCSALLCLLLGFDAAAESEIVDPYRLYTYEQMTADLAALEARYPRLISAGVIGQTAEGREIPAFTLGTGKREILLCASLHAREYISTNFVMYMAEQYAKGYAENSSYGGIRYTEMLDRVRFVIVPMMNPDGVTLAQTGAASDLLDGMERVDLGDNGYYAWKANLRGVDLNRNYPYNWGPDEDVTAAASANYCGPYAASEPETQAMLRFLEHTPFEMLCSFHTSGEYIYWIDNFNPPELYQRFKPIVKRIAAGVGYRMCPVEDISDFGGYMVNYARGTYEKVSMTVELCPLFCLYPYTSYDRFRTTVDKVYPIGLLMAQEVLQLPCAEDGVDVAVNGKLVFFPDRRPMLQDGRTLIPIRAVAQLCGLSVSWDEARQAATLSDGVTSASFCIGSSEMSVDGAAVSLDCAPQLIDKRTLLPLRAVMEVFGASVDWNAASRTVELTFE